MSRKRKPLTRSSTPGRVLVEAFGDLVDPQEFLRDEPGSVYTGLYSDREGGRNGVTIRNEQDLTLIRGAARAICDVSVHAKCALNNLANYCISGGIAYDVRDRTDGPRPADYRKTDVAKAAHSIVAEFLERTGWGSASKRKRILKRKHRDGELFARLTAQGGVCDVRILEPALITQPISTAEEWLFGIQTDPDDVESILQYHVQWSPQSTDDVPPERMCHWRVNVDDNVKRGLSDFYPVELYLSRASKLLRNTAGGAAVLAAIAAIIEHPVGTTQGAVESFRAGSNYNQRTEGTPKGGRQQYLQKYNEASFVHVPQGQKYAGSPLGTAGVGEAMVVIEQAVLRAVACNWSMPEYMISGDASNNNYASILEAGTPFTLFVESIQADIADEDRELLWKVLRIAYDAGRLKGFGSWEETKAALEINIEAPQVTKGTKPEETNRRKTLRDEGVLSVRTWAAQEGLDYEQETANGAARVVEQPSDSAVPQNRLAEAVATLWGRYPGDNKNRGGA
jgi:hypothetical protein